MKKIIGYVITNEGQPAKLCDWGDAVTLAWSDTFTLFSHRKHAKTAIRQAIRYSDKNGLAWVDDYEIIPVIAE